MVWYRLLGFKVPLDIGHFGDGVENLGNTYEFLRKNLRIS